MFGWGKRKSAGEYDKHAIAALHLLDAAIRQVHPERFVDEMDGVFYRNPPRILVNTFLGRPQTERFFPLDYEGLVARFGDYTKKKILEQAMKEMERGDAVAYALMRGVWQEFKLRLLKKEHDKFNLGMEVQSSTKMLIDCLNIGSSNQREPMPK